MDDQTKDVVREVLARLARGEHVKAMARELGVDKQTLKRWRQRGAWRPRAPRVYPKAIDAYRPFLERCGPEGGWNGGLLRSLQPLQAPPQPKPVSSGLVEGIVTLAARR